MAALQLMPQQPEAPDDQMAAQLERIILVVLQDIESGGESGGGAGGSPGGGAA